MKYEIDSYTLSITTKCTDDYSCLSGEDACLCEVEKLSGIPGGGLFIKRKSEVGNCQYKTSFGLTSYVCKCPVRMGIFRKYDLNPTAVI